MKLVYDVSDKPKFSKTIVFAFQQMIAIMAATLLVPMIVSSYGLVADPAAALFGAGIGTLVYIFFTKKKSPVFLGSSFTFLGAYAASIGQNFGYLGIIIGVLFAGLVYVVIGIIIKAVGSGWVNKLMPAVIIGPIVALIGLSLSGTATGWMASNGGDNYSLLTILVGAVTFFAIVIASVKGSQNIKLIPFIVGIGVGYVFALILTLIGKAAGNEAMQILSFDSFKSAFVPFSVASIVKMPDFFFLKAIQEKGWEALSAADIGSIALIYVPIGVVELAQHIADHKNLGNIINKDLITDPGLDNTLFGDGVGSIVGSIFGGAANTTYGESIGCVAITGNASIISIITAAIGCMVLSFFTPFVALINSIPKCVMGGACVALYGFIAVSGLQMLRKVDLNNSKNLFIVSGILVTGIGGLTLQFGFNEMTQGPVLTVTSLAVALIFGIITNLIVNDGKLVADSSETDKK
ncbi:MAG: uracil-xanthine permease [Clostridiales bacterium]|nr:uracil-xanthine permease [Clostridiales bacterium]MBQ2156919.1 uracil-xanthine permease [Clostridiales bacterium]